MKFQEIPFAVMRLQYQIARLPLQLIEQQLAARLAAEAPARLFYERSLGALDMTVGNLLDVPELRRRGAALVKRSSILGRGRGTGRDRHPEPRAGRRQIGGRSR